MSAGVARRVLLTGARGFIGSQALKPLLERGYEVHALGREPGRAADGVQWHRVDLLDPPATSALVRELSASHMLHLAWYTEHGSFWSGPENLDWTGATLHLLRAFAEAGGSRAVLAGTCAEYDWTTPTERFREMSGEGDLATPLRPHTLYGTAKHATRLLATAYARQVGVSLAWGRVFLLYGPGEDERRLVPHVARCVLAGREAQTTAGTQVRDFMHVFDVAGAFAALLDGDVQGPVNVASGQGVTLAEVVSLVAEAADRPDLLRLGALPQREGEPDSLVADATRLRDEVGFEPAMSLREGIADTVGWWRAREASRG